MSQISANPPATSPVSTNSLFQPIQTDQVATAPVGQAAQDALATSFDDAQNPNAAAATLLQDYRKLGTAIQSGGLTEAQAVPAHQALEKRLEITKNNVDAASEKQPTRDLLTKIFKDLEAQPPSKVAFHDDYVALNKEVDAGNLAEAQVGKLRARLMMGAMGLSVAP